MRVLSERAGGTADKLAILNCVADEEQQPLAAVVIGGQGSAAEAM